jgi:hypothetical protein
MFAAGKTAGASSGSTVDAQFNYVTMLLHGDGTNGAQNNTFLDSSTNNFTITRNGNTTQGSFSPYGSNWSNFFNGSSGTGAYLTAPSSSTMQLGSGNFTIECWVFLNKVAENAFIGRSPFDNTNNEWVFQTGTSNELRFAYSTNGSDTQTIFGTATTIPISTWTHVAVVRNSSTLTFYINGTSVGTNSMSATIYSGNTTTTIGSYAQSAYPNGYAVPNGYLSNIRVVKGTAVYTSNFTPSTTPLTAISGTSMLTCQSNRFLDNSSNNFTFTTVNGAPSVQRFNPFGTATAYSTSVIGGSGYFDGSGDYLSAASNTAFAIGTGQYTMECWVYFNSVTNINEFLYTGIDTSSGYLTFYYNGGSLSVVATGGAGPTTASFTFVSGQWYHIAASRDSSNNQKLFVNGALLATATSTNNYTQNGFSAFRAASLNGYCSDVRLLKGTCLYTAAFTPPSAPLTPVTNTSLLLNYTNAGILDNAMMNDLETVGNAQISTSVVKYGTGSMYFDGTGDYLSTPSAPSNQMGSASFTIEAWIYPTTISSLHTIVGKYVGGNISASEYFLYITSTGRLAFAIDGNLGEQYIETGTGAIVVNTWTYIAAIRTATAMAIYINGTLSTVTGFSTNTLSVNTTPLNIGAYNNGSGTYFGYIDELRITKGVARYSGSSFTPPTAAFPNTGPN